VTNNDILRRLRYTFDLNDSKMMALFKHDDVDISREQISNYLKKDDDVDFLPCIDVQLAIFLNNFIDEKRGKKEGAQPRLEKHLTNNVILRKLKIALDLKENDMLEIMAMADFIISKHELSALFRKKGHKHHRVCKDQILRNFLQGLQKKYRADD